VAAESPPAPPRFRVSSALSLLSQALPPRLLLPPSLQLPPSLPPSFPPCREALFLSLRHAHAAAAAGQLHPSRPCPVAPSPVRRTPLRQRQQRPNRQGADGPQAAALGLGLGGGRRRPRAAVACGPSESGGRVSGPGGRWRRADGAGDSDTRDARAPPGGAAEHSEALGACGTRGGDAGTCAATRSATRASLAQASRQCC
jgi:hypothetical protein